MNRQMSFLGLLLVVLALTACGDKAPTQSSSAGSGGAPKASTPQKTAATGAVGPGDLRLGMNVDQMLASDFLKTAQKMPSSTETVFRFKRELFGDGGGSGNATADMATALLSGMSGGGNVEIGVTDGKVAAITLQVGSYSKERLDTVLTALQKNYEVVGPSTNELDDYNSGRRACVSWMDSSTQVAAIVQNSPLKDMAARKGVDMPPEISVIYRTAPQMQSSLKQCGPRALLKTEEVKL